jgi:ribosomal protein S18 acetylase RimI-like enzyme
MAQRHVTLVAVRSAAPIGFAVMEPGDAVRSAELVAIAVLRTQRGRGLGWQLLRAVERAAAARGAPELRARTADFNLAALDLFLRSGYRIVARHPRYYRDRFDACELARDLAGPAPA